MLARERSPSLSVENNENLRRDWCALRRVSYNKDVRTQNHLHLPRPTNAELEILRVLWRRGPSTVREVCDDLSKTGYTTILKLLQIMAEKGLVEREMENRAHLYRAKSSEDVTQQSLVDDLLERAFGGSAQKLVLRALNAKKTSPEDLAEIRSLLDRLEEEL